MEEIQFLNYILSIVATLLAAYAMTIAFKCDKEILELKEEIARLKSDIRTTKENLGSQKRINK